MQKQQLVTKFLVYILDYSRIVSEGNVSMETFEVYVNMWVDFLISDSSNS